MTSKIDFITCWINDFIGLTIVLEAWHVPYMMLYLRSTWYILIVEF